MTRADLFAYLRAHCRGIDNTMPLPQIAAALAPDGETLTPGRLKALGRQVQAILEECAGIEGRDVVCSRCGSKPGLYITDDPAEMAPMVRQLSNREQCNRKRKQAIIRKHPQLREILLRTPPLAIRPSGEAVAAQMTMEELSA